MQTLIRLRSSLIRVYTVLVGFSFRIFVVSTIFAELSLRSDSAEVLMFTSMFHCCFHVAPLSMSI